MHRLKVPLPLLLLVGLSATILAGCASISMKSMETVTGEKETPLQLKRRTQIEFIGRIGARSPITLPKGAYFAAFRDKQGIYYQAENPLVGPGILITGGVFLPNNHQGFGSVLLWTLNRDNRVNKFQISDGADMDNQFEATGKPGQ